MAPYEIKNLEELVKFKGEIVNISLTNLTTPGENYGSVIFAVDITVKTGENLEVVRAVAKMIPRNKFIQDMFKTDITFRQEVGFYRNIAPCLRNFQTEKGLTEVLSSYPEFYGARESLEPSGNKLDENAVLLIKNIKEEGFVMVDRRIGFDLEQARLILEKMAELHATFYALKSLKPEVFERELAQFFHQFTMYEDKGDGLVRLIDGILNLIKGNDFCRENLTKIREAMEFCANVGYRNSTKNNKKYQQSQFSTFVHLDAWTNNIMIKIVEDKTVDVKFVDFQLYEYSSSTRDVVFFLLSSVQIPVIEESFESLLKHYFDCYIKWLQKLKFDISVFEYGDFLREMGWLVREAEFFHLMLMLRPMYAHNEDTKEVENLSKADFLDFKNDVAEGCLERASFIVREMIRRNWI